MKLRALWAPKLVVAESIIVEKGNNNSLQISIRPGCKLYIHEPSGKLIVTDNLAALTDWPNEYTEVSVPPLSTPVHGLFPYPIHAEPTDLGEFHAKNA